MKLKNKISNFLYRLFRTLILKIRVMIPSLYRPGSDPFISGDTFRKLAKLNHKLLLNKALILKGDLN